MYDRGCLASLPVSLAVNSHLSLFTAGKDLFYYIG